MVFSENSGDLADGVLDASADRLNYERLLAPEGLVAPSGWEFFLAETTGESDFTRIARKLGLRPLEGAGGLRVSPGCGDLLDLIHPELAHKLAIAALERAEGQGILTSSPFMAFHLARMGGVIHSLADLGSRKDP
jgi:hypothetical protein